MQQPDNNAVKLKPVCGACGAGREPESIAPVVMTQTVLGPALCAVFFCGNPSCGVIYSMQVLEMVRPGQMPPEPQSKIIVPS